MAAQLTGFFNHRIQREIYVCGSANFFVALQKVCEGLPFVKLIPGESFSGSKTEVYFVVAEADFNNVPKLQQIARDFAQHNSVNAHKIVYDANISFPEPNQKFFSAEIGASLMVAGSERDVELRNYVKRVSVQSEQLGSTTYYEAEIARLARKADHQGLRSIDERLSRMGKDSDDTLRLRAVIAQIMDKPKIYEANLKKILQNNPQNIWAANELGKYYLSMRRAGDGIEVLSKLSAFNNLNGERLLILGDAYLNSGQAELAQRTFREGLELNGQEDERFENGIAKAQAAVGDVDSALKTLKDMFLPESVVSYLNTRAILAIKTKNFPQGLKLYEHALSRCFDNDVVKAKLAYNFGLGCIRANDPWRAVGLFELSLQFGGTEFKRAGHPLKVARQIVKTLGDKGGDAVSGNAFSGVAMDDMTKSIRDPLNIFDDEDEAA